jgi:hypothetical protein
MPRPELSAQQRVLDFDAPIRTTPLPQAAVSQWLDRRFER